MGSGRDKRKKAKGGQAGQGGIKTAKKTEKNDAKAVRRAEKRAEVSLSFVQSQGRITVCVQGRGQPTVRCHLVAAQAMPASLIDRYLTIIGPHNFTQHANTSCDPIRKETVNAAYLYC